MKIELTKSEARELYIILCWVDLQAPDLSKGQKRLIDKLRVALEKYLRR